MFRVYGLGFRFWGQGLVFRFRLRGSYFRVLGDLRLGLGWMGLGICVLCLGSMCYGLWIRG